MVKKFDNGSYQLMDDSKSLHKTRVNGWQLKTYCSQVLEDQANAVQENLDINKPLGLIAQDPSLAQHVPYITSMSLGPITRPCIDTFLCDPGTTIDHLSIGGEDECTSRLQGGDCITEGLEHKA